MTNDSDAGPGLGPHAAPAVAQGFRVVAVLALALAALVLLDEVSRAQNVLADWHAYYRAATNLLAGRDIYAEGRLLLERDSYDFWVDTDGQYVYPPLLAMLVSPLAATLDIGKAGDVWLALLALAAVGALGAVALALGRPPRPETLAALAVPALASVPVLLSIRYGQVDLLLVLGTTLSLLAHVRGRDWLAGLALGLAVAIKPTLALYGLFFLRKRRWSTLVIAAITGLALGLGPLLALGGASLADWLAIAAYFSGGEYPSYPSNQSLRGWLLRAFAGGPRHTPLLASPALAVALWLLMTGAALALWWRCLSGRATTGARAMAEFSLTVALILLIAPLSEDIHYVALLPALALLGDQAAWGAPGRARWWAPLALVAAGYFAMPWLDFAYNRGGGTLSRLVYSGAYLYGLALVAAALATLLLAERRAAQPAAPIDAPGAGDL
ncbi:MAG: DUF2029 domain-containing protein [Chloroflexi bacterium]|nr:DUF2029 domain-containing protein [Chloroflexota bacterium]